MADFTLRIRIGIAPRNGKWHVVVDKGEGVQFCDPGFDTEAEAEAKAQALSKGVREGAKKKGLGVI